MNRRQAKIYSKLTKEEVEVVSPGFNTECYELMKAFGEGARITYCASMGPLGDYVAFDSPSVCYKILPETHIINEREVPAPSRVKPNVCDWYWRITGDYTALLCTQWEGGIVDNRCFELGNCFATKEDAQANFNAMWKVEE